MIGRKINIYLTFLRYPMKWTIKPYIFTPEETYRMLLVEIHQLTVDEINDIIDSCSMVMKGIENELYWGWHVSSLDMWKETTRLSYNDSFVTEIPTAEIYNMLVIYRDRLIEYENEQTRPL